MFDNLKTRMLDLARSPNAERALFAVSFAESSFFPIPPDLMLGPMAASTPHRWLRLALVCTVASVLGGLLGYAIGHFLWDSVGSWIIAVFGYAGKEEALREFYAKWGAWFIFIKGLTPIPFKLVTIVSGALSFSIPIFIAACIITRGLRFLLVAWVFQKFGPRVAPMVEKRLGIVLALTAAAIIGAVVAARFLI